MDPTKRGVIRQLSGILMQRIIGFVLFIAAAGTITDLRGNIYFAAYFTSAVVACAMMYHGHQQTVAARQQKHQNTAGWDKVLLPVLVFLLFFGIYLVAGFGVRFRWARLSDVWLYTGYGLFVASYVLSLWPVLENRHFESTVRLQEDRGHTVVSTGPYRFVRHPGYLGGILGATGVALVFGTLPVAITAVVVIVIFVVRTHLEDSLLKRELNGYPAYANQVKYRLLPFVW